MTVTSVFKNQPIPSNEKRPLAADWSSSLPLAGFKRTRLATRSSFCLHVQAARRPLHTARSFKEAAERVVFLAKQAAISFINEEAEIVPQPVGNRGKRLVLQPTFIYPVHVNRDIFP